MDRTVYFVQPIAHFRVRIQRISADIRSRGIRQVGNRSSIVGSGVKCPPLTFSDSSPPRDGARRRDCCCGCSMMRCMIWFFVIGMILVGIGVAVLFIIIALK